MVFLGIAVAVYHYFFKVLGIFLFLVEIAWFVMRPFWSEARVWIAQRERIGTRHRLVLAAIGLVALLVLAFPWARSVRGEGWLHAEQQQLIYSPFPARVASLHPGGAVKAGDTLVLLDSPDTRSKAVQSRILADALALQLDQTVGRSDGVDKRAILAEQLGQQLAELGAQQAELRRLSLTAPFDGVLLDFDHDVRKGVWITANQPVALLIDPASWVVDALVEQNALQRIRPGSQVRFYRRGSPQAPVAGEVMAIDSARAQVLPHPMLATDHGGRVPAAKQSNGALVPRDALYRVRIRVARDAGQPLAVGLGSAVIEGERRSLLADAWTAVASVFIRESGF